MFPPTEGGVGIGISMKLATNIHNAIGHCCKGFQDQRSEVKVKVMTRSIITYNGEGIPCVVEAHLFLLKNFFCNSDDTLLLYYRTP